MAKTAPAPADAARLAGPQFTLHGTMPVQAVITLSPEEAAFTDEAIARRIREGLIDWRPDGTPVLDRVNWPASGGCA